MIKISVVIPVYNEEKSINILLQSLSNQSHKPNEILISDGGSTDNTLSIINKFKCTDIKIKVYNRIGKCRGSGRNEGIKNASNDLIALIDAGTYADKYWLEKLLQSLNNSDKNIDIIEEPESTPLDLSLPVENGSITKEGGDFSEKEALPDLSVRKKENGRQQSMRNY